MITCIDPKLNVADGVQLAHDGSASGKTLLSRVCIEHFIEARMRHQASVPGRSGSMIPWTLIDTAPIPEGGGRLRFSAAASTSFGSTTARN